MSNNKFPWNCGDCPMLHTYDMSIDDLTHICLWSKEQIDDCDRYKSAECPMEKHDSELLDKVASRIKEELSEYDFWWYQEFSSNGGYVGESTHDDLIDKVIAEMKAGVQKGAENE